MKRVILTTGGTGGHIFPALAVAEEIRRRYAQAELLFMGGEYGQEADLAVKAGLDFVGLPVRGVMGRGLKGLGAAASMGKGVARALALMRKFKPDLVTGFGGYAAFAGVLAGRMAGAATAIHEQNSYPGMANRLLGKVVDRIFLSMPDTAGVFNAAKCELVGNPVRAGIVALYEQAEERAGAVRRMSTSYYGGVDGPSPFGAAARKKAEAHDDAAQQEADGPGAAPVTADAGQSGTAKPFGHPIRLLVMGGSLGARAINDGMIAAMGALAEADLDIRHQTGQADCERVRAAYRAMNADRVRVEPFINDMPKAYAWADVMLCRAGASTLAELTAAGLPAVLVPFPKAAQDHQRHNARYLAGEGAALVLEQAEFLGNPQILSDTLVSLLRDKTRLRGMAEKSHALAKPYAARQLVDGLEALLARRESR